MIEIEKTYLIKDIPRNLKDCEFKEIIDIYIPKASNHSKLRIRKNGDKFEMTKKEPVSGRDSSYQKEQTIILTEIEFNALSRLEGKRVRKFRYYYNYSDRIAEIDVFQDLLKGLVLVDFEFEVMRDKDNFKMPDFCLADVTQEVFIAGGVICGKNYKDIEDDLNRFGYQKLFLK